MIEDSIGPLIGVVIGGGITHLGTVRVEKRRAQLEQARDDRVDARAERQGTRMIHNELLNIKFDLEAAIEAKTWWNRAELEFATPSWERFADALAASDMDDNSWAWLAHAYNEVESLNERTRRNKREKRIAGAPGLVFDDAVLTVATATHVSVEQGVEFLMAYMNGEPSPAEPPTIPPDSLRSG